MNKLERWGDDDDDGFEFSWLVMGKLKVNVYLAVQSVNGFCGPTEFWLCCADVGALCGFLSAQPHVVLLVSVIWCN